jgi:hypothetical protein
VNDEITNSKYKSFYKKMFLTPASTVQIDASNSLVKIDAPRHNLVIHTKAQVMITNVLSIANSLKLLF